MILTTEMIDANFGQKPFVYDLQRAIETKQDIIAPVKQFPCEPMENLSPAKNEQSPLQSLIQCHDAKRVDGDVSEEAPLQMMSNNSAMASIQTFKSPPRMNVVKREHTAPLRRWFHEHEENPYPTKAEKEALAIVTKLSVTQVAIWLGNARRKWDKQKREAGLPPIKKPPYVKVSKSRDGDGTNLIDLICQKLVQSEGQSSQTESLESFVALSNEEHLEKLTLDAKAEENDHEGICQSDQSQSESDICSCPSESDVCSSLMESLCFAEVVKKLLDRNEKLTVEKEECARKANLDKARADRAVLEVVELKKKVALLEQEKLQISRNSFISPNQCYFLKCISNELAFLHVSSAGNWDKTVPDQLLSCRFKLMLHLDGTFSIYSTFSNKYLEYNKMPGIFGLTENYCSLSAKFEFLYAGQDQCQHFMVKIRSMSGDGYLFVNCLAKKSYSVGISEYATKFTLVPVNE